MHAWEGDKERVDQYQCADRGQMPWQTQLDTIMSVLADTLSEMQRSDGKVAGLK